MMQISFCGMVRLMKMHTWIRGKVHRWGVLSSPKGLDFNNLPVFKQNKRKGREGKRT